MGIGFKVFDLRQRRVGLDQINGVSNVNGKGSQLSLGRQFLIVQS